MNKNSIFSDEICIYFCNSVIYVLDTPMFWFTVSCMQVDIYKVVIDIQIHHIEMYNKRRLNLSVNNCKIPQYIIL